MKKFENDLRTLIDGNSGIYASLDNDKDYEVHEFRREVLKLSRENFNERKVQQKSNVDKLLRYRFPPILEEGPLPKHLADKWAKQLFIKVQHVEGLTPPTKTVTVKIDGVDATVATLLSNVLKQFRYLDSTQPGGQAYVLKFLGREEYLLGDNIKLTDFKQFRQAISKGYFNRDLSDVLLLHLFKRDEVVKSLFADDECQGKETKFKEQRFLQNRGQEVLWTFPASEDNFVIKIMSANNLYQSSKFFGVGVSACIFMGESMIYTPECTRYLTSEKTIKWDEPLEFKIKLCHLPRNSRICFAIHGVWMNPQKLMKSDGDSSKVGGGKSTKHKPAMEAGTTSKKVFKNREPLAWANISIMDYRHCLRTGNFTLQCFKYDSEKHDMEKMFVPLGTLTKNTEKNCVTLDVGFQEYSTTQSDVVFPTKGDFTLKTTISDKLKLSKEEEQQVLAYNAMKIAMKDPLYKLREEEKKVLRNQLVKSSLTHTPSALSKCLSAIDWSRNDASHEVADMLEMWKDITPELAVELLDAGFADQSIRAHAVTALQTMSDEKLISYLLQLVQVLKYEMYLHCDLASFLLTRALKNQRVGHYFFWYLRSEMHIPEVKTQYALLLEAYLRGCGGGHVAELKSQIEGMECMLKCANEIKAPSYSKEDRKKTAREMIAKEKMRPFLLPLEPSLRMADGECKRVMDSKKLPIWMTFKSADCLQIPKSIIVKAGDDLRQDMLTLQLIRIMDDLWQAKGLDLQMNAYACLSTGDEVGMLEVVENAETIASIQGSARVALGDEKVLHTWLCNQAENKTKDEQNAKGSKDWVPGKPAANPEAQAAIHNFMLSCAGYCVATYVLGIGDRHNDNIMVTRTGKLFHIDFGHFLGNFKSKFGIKRERVKFILVPDFVYALTDTKGKDHKSFKDFKEQCKQAYLIVRENASLFINLLNMMLSTGIPELKSHEDVAYLRETLLLDKSEKEAGEEFLKEVDIALKDSWSVRMNWAAHIMAH